MNSLAGLNISETVKVESPEHLADVLRSASDAGQPVLPIGGGTCLSTGYATDHEFLGIDLSGLNGIIDYIPTDMTAGFLAGTPVSMVRNTLAENGQELPVDLAADDAGTIGGLVATGFAGMRRYGQGTLKDLLIGCEYVRGDGLQAKAGGMTVKNVSGFEISRMLHGSWGSLAVMTRMNLKVIPKPRVDRTLVWRDANVKMALERQLRLLEQFPGAMAIQTKQHDDGWDTAIRFTGREPGVEDYERQALSLEGETVAATGADDTWQVDRPSADQPQLVISSAVERVTGIVHALMETGGITHLSVSFGTGTIQARLDPEIIQAGHFPTIDSNLWMIEGGQDAWKRDLQVWGPERADRAVVQSLKHQFDPANILNRGRLFI